MAEESLQLAESQLAQRLFAQIIRRIERLAWHPTWTVHASRARLPSTWRKG
jgi:hypothetical protein